MAPVSPIMSTRGASVSLIARTKRTSISRMTADDFKRLHLLDQLQSWRLGLRPVARRAGQVRADVRVHEVDRTAAAAHPGDPLAVDNDRTDARKLVHATDLQQALQIQSEFLRSQFTNAGEHMRQITGNVASATGDTTKER